MSYHRLVVGDVNVVRFWQAAQLARPQLVGVPLKTVGCVDTLSSALAEVNDALDYVVVSVATTLLLEEATSVDVRGSSLNVFESLVKHITAAAKKSSRVEVFVVFGDWLLGIFRSIGTSGVSCLVNLPFRFVSGLQ